ncbi:MAG: hypothetical protein QF735_06600, partial [Phycisphaeraceae bacterium]|nr:hypothetical protein [Phycisphaeraceae bacterium]
GDRVVRFPRHQSRQLFSRRRLDLVAGVTSYGFTISSPPDISFPSENEVNSSFGEFSSDTRTQFVFDWIDGITGLGAAGDNSHQVVVASTVVTGTNFGLQTSGAGTSLVEGNAGQGGSQSAAMAQAVYDATSSATAQATNILRSAASVVAQTSRVSNAPGAGISLIDHLTLMPQRDVGQSDTTNESAMTNSPAYDNLALEQPTSSSLVTRSAVMRPVLPLPDVLTPDTIESLAMAVLRPDAGSATAWLELESALDDDPDAWGDIDEQCDRI